MDAKTLLKNPSWACPVYVKRPDLKLVAVLVQGSDGKKYIIEVDDNQQPTRVKDFPK